MRILFVNYSPPETGGAEISISLLINELNKKHDVFIASIGEYSIKTFTFREFKKVPNFYLRNLYLTKFLTKIIKKEQIDIIYANDSLTIVSSIKAAKKTNIKVITHYRDCWFICPMTWLVKRDGETCNKCNLKNLLKCSSGLQFLWNLYKLYYLKRIRKILTKADRVIVNSNSTKEKLNKIGVGSIVIPNSVSLDSFNKREETEVFDVLFIGSLYHHKGVLNLLKIAKRMRNTNFLVVGEGPLRDKLEGISNIKLTGKVSYDRIPAIYSKAKIVIFPSIGVEGFGRIALEAIASSKPVIASNMGGIKDIVDNEVGFLVEPNDIDDWVDKINLLLKDDNLREKMSKSGIEKSKSYDIRIITKKVENLICN